VSKDNKDEKTSPTHAEEENNYDSNNGSPTAIIVKDAPYVLNNRDHVFSKLGFSAEAEKFRNSNDSIIKLIESP
jgi:hypothetical protein